MPHVTLSALVDYLGFRLQAMPTLPLEGVEGGSLKLGSGDAGVTVKNESPELAAMFEELAAELGMAPHRILQSADKAEKEQCKAKLVELDKKSEKSAQDEDAIKTLNAELAAFDDKEITMPFGLDVEGHLDREGRPVALDFARVFSPEHIRETKHLSMKTPGTIFVRHLRPELIKKFADSEDGAPLSADALSLFASGASDGPEMNERVKKATKWLLEDVIPKAAQELDQASPIKKGGEISPFLHEKGINVRHMGLVYHHCTKDEVRTALLAEMVARTIKNLMRHAARDSVQRWGRADIAGVRRVFKKLLNLAFSGDNKSSSQQRFWLNDIWDGLRRRFGDRCDAVRTKLRKLVLPNLGAVKHMISRLAEMLGLVFSADCREVLGEDVGVDDHASRFFFTSTDVEALDVRVKYMTMVDRAAGKALLLERKRIHDKLERTRSTAAGIEGPEAVLHVGSREGKEASVGASARTAAAAKMRFDAVLRSTPGDVVAGRIVAELSTLAHIKNVMNRLIRFNDRTRKSACFVQMRDEEVSPVVLDVREGPMEGHADVLRWWLDFVDLVLHEEKFCNVTHLHVGKNVAMRSFKWVGQFDFKADHGMFPVALLRGILAGETKEEAEAAVGPIVIDQLEIGNASGLLNALVHCSKVEFPAGRRQEPWVVKTVKVNPKADQGRLNLDWMFEHVGPWLGSTTEINLRDSNFGGNISPKIRFPRGLKVLDLKNTEIGGDIGAHGVQFPASLEKLQLGNCGNITGDIGNVQWPASLKILDLHGCRGLSGDLSSAQWPKALWKINLNGCSTVTGDLGKMQARWPATLQDLLLGGCRKITGDIARIEWPEGLVYLEVPETGLSGDISKSKWAPKIEKIDLGDCAGITGWLDGWNCDVEEDDEDEEGNRTGESHCSLRFPDIGASFEVGTTKDSIRVGDPINFGGKNCVVTRVTEDFSPVSWPPVLTKLNLHGCDGIAGSMPNTVRQGLLEYRGP